MIKKWNSRFAENIKNFDGYPIGKTIKYLNDPEIISLAGGLPSPDVFQKNELKLFTEKALERDVERIMQYSPIPGETSLFRAVINFLKRDSIHCKEENILITTSGQHGLDLTGRLFLNPGDIVLHDRPTFAGALVSFQMQRPRFIGVDIEPDGSNITGFRKELKKLKKKGKKPKFIYVVPDFQNPTGITMSLEKRKALLDLSYEYNVPVIEDSPYRDLRYYGKTIPAIYSLDQKREGGNVIGLYTFSKLFCPGIRVGFNIGPNDVIAKMTCIKEGNILNTPKYNQDICTAFLEEMNLEAHLQKCRDYYREKLTLFMKLLSDYFPAKTGVTWTKPEGGLFLWITVPKRIDTDKLFYQAIKNKVAFVPGWQFYSSKPEKNHMRINFSFVALDKMKLAIERLAECIRNYK